MRKQKATVTRYEIRNSKYCVNRIVDFFVSLTSQFPTNIQRNGLQRTSLSLPRFFVASQRHFQLHHPQTPPFLSHLRQISRHPILHRLQTQHLFLLLLLPPPSQQIIRRRRQEAQGLPIGAVPVLPQGPNQERTLPQIPRQVPLRLAQLPPPKPYLLRLPPLILQCSPRSRHQWQARRPPGNLRRRRRFHLANSQAPEEDLVH